MSPWAYRLRRPGLSWPGTAPGIVSEDEQTGGNLLKEEIHRRV
jgi:hypothetical protein